MRLLPRKYRQARRVAPKRTNTSQAPPSKRSSRSAQFDTISPQAAAHLVRFAFELAPKEPFNRPAGRARSAKTASPIKDAHENKGGARTDRPNCDNRNQPKRRLRMRPAFSVSYSSLEAAVGRFRAPSSTLSAASLSATLRFTGLCAVGQRARASRFASSGFCVGGIDDDRRSD